MHIDDEIKYHSIWPTTWFGIEVESGLTQSWKSTKLWCCQHYCCMRNVDSLPTTWQKLNHFHTSCLRKLLKIKRQDRIPDTEVLKRAGMQSIHTLLKLAQLRWAGHITRMPEERLPKKILYGELEMGKRSHCAQNKRYKDTVKASLQVFNIPTESWTEQSGEASSEEMLVNMRQKESASPSRNVHSAKFCSVVPSATDSLELELV